MEFMLLWIDDLDDAFGTARHLAPKILGFLFAVALFIGTGFALVRAPHIALGFVAFALSVALLEAVRRRHRTIANHG